MTARPKNQPKRVERGRERSLWERRTRFVAQADCAIEELETADCHLDDDDVALFLERALRNRNLVLSRWNLAKNSIGAAVDHAPAASDRPSLASWIGSDECTCKRLDISWNMIRGSVAVALGKALSTNHYCVLDLSNNGLGPKAAFAMSVALLGRMSALELLVMDGNPVGVTGGQALLRVLTRMDHRAHLSLRDCSFHGGSIGERWIINDDYTLDLSVPILYCLARDDILQGDATRPCPPIDCCYLTPPGGASQRIRTKIEWTGARARPSTGDAYDEAHSRARARQRRHAARVAGRTRDDAGGRFVVFDEATGEDFAQTLPEAGVLRLCFAKAVVKLGMDEPMTQAGVVGWATSLGAIQDVLQVAEAADNHLLVLQMALPSLVLGHDTAARLFPALVAELLDPVAAIAKLLPRMASPLHVQAFIRAMLPKSTNRSRLQRAMGQRFQLLIDMPAGHYTLRLDKMEEREVLVALLQANRFERHRVVARAKRSLESGAFDENCFHYPYVDTSQHGNRSGFRNETLDGSAVEICDELLDGLGPSPKGLLEFDFVKMTRPPRTAEPMTRAHFSQLLSVAAISDDVDDRCLQLAVEGAKTPREEKRPPRPRPAPSDGRRRSSAAQRASRISKMGLGLGAAFVERTVDMVVVGGDAPKEDAADRAMRSTRMSKVAGPPGRPPGGEAAEDDGDKAAQDSLMEAQQKLAQAMPDVGKGGAAGGDHRRSTYKPRMQSINAVSQDTAERFKSWFKGEEGGVEAAREEQRARHRLNRGGSPSPPSYGRRPQFPDDGAAPAAGGAGGSPGQRRAAARDGTIARGGERNPLEMLKRRKPATPDTDEPTPDGTPSATPKATTRSVGKKPASPALGGGSEMLRASSKSGKSKLNKLKTIARMMISGAGAAKSAADTELILARLNEFHLLLAGCWFSAAQACTLLRRWQLFDGPKLRNRDVLKLLRPQVELVIMLHSRIVDLYNIDEVFAVLDPTMRAEAIFRLGTLNIWSPLKPDGPYSLNLGLREDRQVVRMLVHLHEAEQAVWRNPTLRWKLDMPRHEDWSTRIVLAALTLAGVDEDDDDLLSEMPQSEPLEAMLAASLDAAHIKWVYDGITVADPVPRRPKDLPGGRDSLIQAKSRSATPEA
ncbi:hypothetical protein JL722_803 [Aureococcus anophagefferens]|nr:hypothetical protein JL722_803 [Aureococcus anophagefferens]